MALGEIRPVDARAWQHPPGPPLLSEPRYRERLGAVREVARSRGLDVLLVSQPENVLWLTGFEMAGTFYFVQVVVPTDPDAEVSILSHKADADLARVHSWVKDVRVWRHGQDHVEELRKLLLDRGLRGESLRFGAEVDGWYRLTDATRVEAAIGTPLVDVTTDLEALRVVADDEDLVNILRAASAAERGVFAALGAVRTGVRESEVAAASARAYYLAGGENPSVWPQIASGQRARMRHALASDRQVLPGEVVTVELWGAHRRYSAIFARTAVAAKPSPTLLNQWTVLQEALEAGREALRPGATGGTVWSAMREVLEAGDGQAPERLGLGMGLSFPLLVRWSLAVEKENRTELISGMPIALVPALYAGPESSAVLGETYLVSEKGGIRLTMADRELVTG